MGIMGKKTQIIILMKNIVFLFGINFFLFVHSDAQIITKIEINTQNLDSVEKILSTTFHKYENICSKDATVFLYNEENSTLGLLDTFYNKREFIQEKMIFTFYTLLVPRYNHILLYYENTMYLINMRNPLDSILQQIKQIPNFSRDFIDKSFQIVEQEHRRNWKNHHKDYYIDEYGVLQLIFYDPKKW